MTRSKEPIARFEGYHFLDHRPPVANSVAPRRSPPRYAAPSKPAKSPAATRLPSTRALAKRLAVSRNTVLTAYEELAADGNGDRPQGLWNARNREPSVRARIPVLPDPRAILRAGHYPLEMASFVDPEGNPLMAVRTV